MNNKEQYVVMAVGSDNDFIIVNAEEPVTSIKKAKELIQKNIDEFVQSEGEEFELGEHDDILMNYHILKVVEKYKPTLKVTAKTTLRKIK